MIFPSFTTSRKPILSKLKLKLREIASIVQISGFSPTFLSRNSYHMEEHANVNQILWKELIPESLHKGCLINCIDYDEVKFCSLRSKSSYSVLTAFEYSWMLTCTDYLTILYQAAKILGLWGKCQSFPPIQKFWNWVSEHLSLTATISPCCCNLYTWWFYQCIWTTEWFRTLF